MNSLADFVDMHIHTAPDVRPRRLDDLEAAGQAAREKMKAIVLKCHVGCTAGRAALAEKVSEGVRVFGSIVLNDHIGGINPLAVEAAIKMGAKIVWLPTISAANHKRYNGERGGISLTPDNQQSFANLASILEIVRDNDSILATGHISVEEIVIVVHMANRMGIKKCMVTHPEVPWIDMPVDIQVELRNLGAFFERCYVSTKKIGGGVPFNRITNAIQQVGIDTTVISTDYGAQLLDPPIKGFQDFLTELTQNGFSDTQLLTMGSTNPSALLGI